jgi:hypothetical protein
MHSPPTIIERFLNDVVTHLRDRDADGAAQSVWRFGATLEPRDRSSRKDAEWQRLLLLADRIGREWVPTIVATLRVEGLLEVARQQPPIRDASDAAAAADRVGSLRNELASLGPAPRAATVADVSAALVSLQSALRRISDGSEEQLSAAATVAIHTPRMD